MMRARGGLGGGHPLLIGSESAQTFEHTFTINLAKHCIQHFFFFKGHLSLVLNLYSRSNKIIKHF